MTCSPSILTRRRWVYMSHLLLMAVVVLAGCGGGNPEGPALAGDSGKSPAAPDQEATDGTEGLAPEARVLVQQAVAIADAIEATPEDMAIILADENLTAEEYVAMIYRISADPVLAQAYADARDQ